MAGGITVEAGAVAILAKAPGDGTIIKTGAIVIVNGTDDDGAQYYSANEIIKIIEASRAAAMIFNQPPTNPDDLQ